MKFYLKTVPLTLLFLLFASSPSYAAWYQVSYSIESGTGFFINHEDIVTNAHVVKGCTHVIVKGAIPEHDAVVKFVDEERDLAVLETTTPPPEYAPLRYNIDDLKAGDKVMVIGYPGQAGVRGEYKVAEAQIEDIKINDSSDKWLYISDVVAHGNSGGPVFDTTGNVIGVVVGMATITYYNSTNHAVVSEQKAGVVITLKTLMQFLFDHGVFSELGGSGVVFSDSYLEERARNYIVNVQCRLKTNNGPPQP